MQFDHTYRPAWPANMIAVVEPVFLARRDAGLSVQFINDMGQRDEWQFTTTAQRDAFVAAKFCFCPAPQCTATRRLSPPSWLLCSGFNLPERQRAGLPGSCWRVFP